MVIAPNTIIRLLHDVPLDPTYDHTVLFYTQGAQAAYFATKSKYTFTAQTYQRHSKGTLRISASADTLYDCNYLMFQNSAYGNKWFYAFVTNVEYINNAVAEVSYQIDHLQTWMFDYSLDYCFVAREHSVTDNIGDNTIPEGLELGEYTTDGFEGVSNLDSKSIIVAATFDKDYNDSAGDIYGGIYSGLHYNVFPATLEGANQINEFLQNVGVKSAGIVSIFVMPSAFATSRSLTPPTVTYAIPKSQISIGGYIPKNKKLLTYPYNFLYITNNQGSSAQIKYEYFTTTQCTFTLYGDMSCTPSVIMIPAGYKGAAGNVNEKIALTGFPQLSYNIDTYKAWVAQESSKLLGSVITSPVSFAVTSNPKQIFETIGSAVNLASADIVRSALQQNDPAYTMPLQASGAQGSTVLLSANLLNFSYTCMHIRDEYARIIDDYFNMFGYATNRVKIPSLRSRPHWNYVKTVACVITGSIPADAASEICKIYDNGITFWHNPNEIGDYSLDNSPITDMAAEENINAQI